MYKLNFNHLYYFWIISVKGSVVKAAKHLHMTQPALSMQLKQFEEELGVQLFVRKGRGLMLSKQGLILKNQAANIFRMSEEILLNVNTSNHNQKTELKIGVIPWIPKEIINKFIRPLLTIYSLKLTIVQMPLDELSKQFVDQKLDVIITDQLCDLISPIKNQYLLESCKLGFINARKFRNRNSFNDFYKKYHFISVGENSYIHRVSMHQLERNEIAPTKICNYDSLEAIVNLILEHRSFSCVPIKYIKKDIMNLLEVGFELKTSYQVWCLTQQVIKRDGLLSKSIHVFA